MLFDTKMLQTGNSSFCDRETVWLFHETKLWKQLEITVYILYRGSCNNKRSWMSVRFQTYLLDMKETAKIDRMTHFDLTTLRLFRVPHLLWHRTSAYGLIRGIYDIDNCRGRWQLNIYNGLSRRGLEHQSLRMLSERSTDTTEPPLRWKGT